MSENKIFYGLLIIFGFSIIGSLSKPPRQAAAATAVQAAPAAQAAQILPNAPVEPRVTIMFEGAPVTWTNAQMATAWDNCQFADRVRRDADSEMTSSWSTPDTKIEQIKRVQQLGVLNSARGVSLCEAIAAYKIEH